MADIQFFGRISDLMGQSLEIAIPGTGISAGNLRQTLAERHDCLEMIDPKIRLACNDVIVENEHIVKNTDTLAFLSPFSGG